MEGNHPPKLESAGIWVVDLVDIIFTKLSDETSHSRKGMEYILLSFSTPLMFLSLQLKSLIKAALNHWNAVWIPHSEHLLKNVVRIPDWSLFHFIYSNRVWSFWNLTSSSCTLRKMLNPLKKKSDCTEEQFIGFLSTRKTHSIRCSL